MDELLTTRQVAAELQVSESSVKRWCDQGLIRTQRTAGGHRRIERSSLRRFLALSRDHPYASSRSPATNLRPNLLPNLNVPPQSADSSAAAQDIGRNAAQGESAQGESAQGESAQGSERASTSQQVPFARNSSSDGTSTEAKLERGVTDAWTPSARVAEGIETYATLPRADLVGQFQQALVAGDELRCRDLITKWTRRFPGTAKMGDQLIAGAMERIGRMWECGRAEVFEERRSCEVCMHLLHELRSQVAQPSSSAPRAVGGTLAGDHYALASQLVELVLRESGWNATNLGGNLPLEAMLTAVRRERPRLLWLSISHVPEIESFIKAYEIFYAQLPADLVVAVGGRALTDELRPRIGYTAHCDNLEQLAALAQAISGAP